jgi:surface antigen
MRKRVATILALLVAIDLVGVVLCLEVRDWRRASAAAQTPRTGPEIAADSYGYPYPAAPDCDEAGDTCPDDVFGMWQGQCTSWVAFRLNTVEGIAFNDHFGGLHWGHARRWGLAALALGMRVDGDPEPGTVAWWRSGHVAFVEDVLPGPEVVISEMNYDGHNGFRRAIITPDHRWPTGFVHVTDRAPNLGALGRRLAYL